MGKPERMRLGDLAYVTELVRANDRPRYYSTLFSPTDLRPALLAIYGFAAEIARVPDQVSESGLGEIRLQWWRDALLDATEREAEGDAPAIRALADVIRRHALPFAAFEALIEARAFDLYSDAPPLLANLEGRLGETESALFQMAAIVAGGEAARTAEAAGHAGISYGIARRLAHFARERARGRAILPADMLATQELTAADVFAADPPLGLQNVVGAMSGIAREHLAMARRHAADLPPSTRRVFLPLAVVEPLLVRVKGFGADILRKPAALSDFSMLSRIGLMRLRQFGAR